MCQDVQIGCFPRTLRERSAELLDRGSVPIDKIVKEILRTCPELDSSIGGGNEYASVQIHGRTVCGFDDLLTCERLGRAAEIARDGKHVGDIVMLGVGHHGTRQLIAELSRRIVLMDDAACQVAILVIVALGTLVEGGTVEDIEGADAASTDDAGIQWTVGKSSVTLADRAVSDGLAGFERRWRWSKGDRYCPRP